MALVRMLKVGQGVNVTLPDGRTGRLFIGDATRGKRIQLMIELPRNVVVVPDVVNVGAIPARLPGLISCPELQEV